MVDATDEASVQAMVEKIVKEFGRIDYSANIVQEYVNRYEAKISDDTFSLYNFQVTVDSELSVSSFSIRGFQKIFKMATMKAPCGQLGLYQR